MYLDSSYWDNYYNFSVVSCWRNPLRSCDLCNLCLSCGPLPAAELAEPALAFEVVTVFFHSFVFAGAQRWQLIRDKADCLGEASVGQYLVNGCSTDVYLSRCCYGAYDPVVMCND